MEQGVMRMERATREENERKKEYLRRYLEAKRMQEVLEREIDELRLDRMTPSGLLQDGMPHGSSGGGDLSGYVARLDELDRKLRAQMYKKIQLRAEITERIDAMENETESLLLRLRYIHGLKWEEVAVKMDYSWKQIHRLHSKALNNFKMT